MTEVIDLRKGGKGAELARVGMVLFLVSWGVTFGALFLAYGLVRVRQPSWPPPGAPSLGTVTPVVNTLVALGSSVAFDAALRAVRAGRLPAFRALIGVASALALTFLGVQARLWASLGALGFKAGEGVYAGMFYMMTWFHAAHVVVALGIVGWMLPGILRGRYNAREHQPVKLAAWFWHFVTVVWIGVLLAVYVV